MLSAWNLTEPHRQEAERCAIEAFQLFLLCIDLRTYHPRQLSLPDSRQSPANSRIRHPLFVTFTGIKGEIFLGYGEVVTLKLSENQTFKAELSDKTAPVCGHF